MINAIILMKAPGGNAVTVLTNVMILIRVRGDPQAILRSLIDRLSAQGVGRYLKGPLTTAVRNYFLDKMKPLPDGLWAFYWPMLSGHTPCFGTPHTSA
jgi:hypothetical protein